MLRYRVTAACVPVKAARGGILGGPGLVTVYRGGFLPLSADPESVARLLRKGMVEEVDVPAESVTGGVA